MDFLVLKWVNLICKLIILLTALQEVAEVFCLCRNAGLEGMSGLCLCTGF